MSDPLNMQCLQKGDIIAKDVDDECRGVVVDTLLFKKPIYKVEFTDDDGLKTISYFRASLTKKGRAGKQFVEVSKEDGGRWSAVENGSVMVRVDPEEAATVPATPTNDAANAAAPSTQQ